MEVGTGYLWLLVTSHKLVILLIGNVSTAHNMQNALTLCRRELVRPKYHTDA